MDNYDITGSGKRRMEEEWKAFFHSYYDALFRHACRMLKNETEAEDIVQEVFVSLWDKQIDIKNTDYLSGYLYRAVTNRCLNFLRDQKRMDERLEQWKRDAEEEASEMEFDSAVREEVIRRLQQLIAELPDGRRRILELSMEGLSGEEIAGKLNISITTVKQQKYRAYQFIREHLGKYWGLVFFILEGTGKIL